MCVLRLKNVSDYRVVVVVFSVRVSTATVRRRSGRPKFREMSENGNDEKFRSETSERNNAGILFNMDRWRS